MALDATLPVREDVPAVTPELGDTTSAIDNAYTGVKDEQQTLADNASASSQPALDIADTTNQIETYAPIATGDESVSSNSLVANQLKTILDPDSELMLQAKSQGQAAAAKSGQLGSTAGMRTTQGALYDRAIEIGARDADTYAQAGRLAQQGNIAQQQTIADTASAGELRQQEYALNERQLALNNSYKTAIQNADQETAAILQDQQGQWQEAMTNLDNDFQEWSTQYQVSAQTKENLLNRMAEAQLNHQIVTQELLGDPSFLELGGAAISNLMNTMVSGVAASIKSDMVAAGYVESDPGMNDMLDAWVDDMTLIDFSGI
jgi:hypothetical protein